MSKLARRRVVAGMMRIDCLRSKSHRAVLAILILAAGIAAAASLGAPQAAASQRSPSINASLVAVNIPGASALAQVGTFLDSTQGACGGSPIATTSFSAYTKTGAVLDPNRILVGSTSNFGAPLPASGGRTGAFLSINPSGPTTLVVPPNFASGGGQTSTLGGSVQMFSANSPHWLNSVNNPNAFTATTAFPIWCLPRSERVISP
jgi:hypothetical protein